MSLTKQSIQYQQHFSELFHLSYEEDQFLNEQRRAKTLRQAEAEAQEGEEIALYFESVIQNQ